MPTVRAFSHVTLTVTDLPASVSWYERALGMSPGQVLAGPGWRRVLMRSGDVVIGLTEHDATAEGERFDETRVGVDHLSLACADRGEVEAWLTALDEAGVAHSELTPLPLSIATCRDPDGIAVEFFAPPQQS